MPKASDNFISRAEEKLERLFTQRKIPTNLLPLNIETFRQNRRYQKIQDIYENDMPLITSDEPLECLGLQCDEHETDCTK